MIAALIQARLNSTRLPKKCLLPLGDSTVLGQVVSRCQLSKKMDDVIVVVAPDDTGELVAECDRLGVLYSKYGNGMRDVLAEYYHAMTEYDVDFVVRITSDCPCVDPWDINRMIRLHLFTKADYTYNRCDSSPNGWADGFDIEVISKDALNMAHHTATLPYDREHVTPYIRRNYRVIEETVPMVQFPEGTKLSIDTKEGYGRVFKLFEKLPRDFKTEDILKISGEHSWEYTQLAQAQAGTKPLQT